MIRLWEVIEAVASAVNANHEVQSICSGYGKPLNLLLGFDGDKPLYAEDSGPIVAITPSDQPYDVGYTGDGNRVASIAIRWAVFENAASVDGTITRYDGVKTCDDLGSAILDAVRGIAGLGDEVTEATMAIDTDEWPNVVGIAQVVFGMARGLNAEPEIS